jgi:hypothetical protein
LFVLVGAIAVSLALGAGTSTALSDRHFVGFETGDLSRFSSVVQQNASLDVSTIDPYGSDYSAVATYAGIGSPGTAAGIVDVSWEGWDDVWYGAAFRLAPGFKLAQQSDIPIIRWDNRPTRGSDADYGGVVISASDNRAHLYRANPATHAYEQLSDSFNVPEGRWFFLAVHQRLSQTFPLNEIYVDGHLVDSSNTPNYFGRPIDRLSYGLVSISQLLPASLQMDRVITRASEPNNPVSCSWAFGVEPWVKLDLDPPSFPPGCWRPFSNDSPVNTPIPDNPRLASNSSEMVRHLTEGGDPNPLRVGIADTPSDYYKPNFYARPTDPFYTIEDSSFLGGERIRMPDTARPAAGSDHHMTVIWNNYHYGFWNAVVNHEARTISAGPESSWLTARKAPLDGPGYGGNNTGCGATASGFCNMAGQIRAQELERGVINHAFKAGSSKIASDYVFPATDSDGSHSEADGYPPMGTRFQLDPNYMTNARLATYPVWEQPILRALRDYGMYLGDSSGANSFSLGLESGTSYTALGLEDEMVKYVRSVGVPRSGDGIYYLNLGNVDWADHLRAIAPCVSERNC